MSWPEHDRYHDHIIAGFYALAFLVIYLIEIEQLIISDPVHFKYPVWPPGWLVDLTHWWGKEYHGALWARPAWYKATIWFDVCFSGPLYLAGIYAFQAKRKWIVYPALVHAVLLLLIVLFSACEEIYGVHAGDGKGVVLASMLLWAVVPAIIIRRTIQIARHSEI